MQKVRISRQSNEARVRLNECFYSRNFIEKAAADFSEVCNVRVMDDMEIVLKPEDPEDLDIIGYEFYNYVLGLIRNS